MIAKLTFHRFKQFKKQSFEFRPVGVSLIAGGNNSGKSSILQGLAVWQFCKTAIEMERGWDTFLATSVGAKQGLGLGDDEFSPISIPSLKHLWTNLKSSKESEPDGYTLKIGCEWKKDNQDRQLEFGLALANDRLFVKVTASNLTQDDRIPNVAYLPPFAGITDREMRLPGAIRRRRIGEGLAGAVLRNLLLDMFEQNSNERVRLRGDKAKISDSDLKRLRETDPWELLQQTLRETFSAELKISPFRSEYHSYIRVEVVKGRVSGHTLKRYSDFNSRDLMVEGSGFLQWLSVYALVVDPGLDVILLDEPDAHLHCSLQDHLLSKLRELANQKQKQILLATHSTEILRHAPHSEVFQVRNRAGSYLSSDDQKIGLLTGMGSDYAPRVDRIKKTKRVFFFEGSSDIAILKALAETLKVSWRPDWVPWQTPVGHKERKQIFHALNQEVPGLRAISLRDRDDEGVGTVGADLLDKSHDSIAGMKCLKWRRKHIESYLLWPPAIASATGLKESDIDASFAIHHALAIPRDSFTKSEAPPALLNADGKAIFQCAFISGQQHIKVSPLQVAKAMKPDGICDDIKIFLSILASEAI